MSPRFVGLRGLLLLPLAALILAAGCASNGKKDQQQLSRYTPEVLYDRGQKALKRRQLQRSGADLRGADRALSVHAAVAPGSPGHHLRVLQARREGIGQGCRRNLHPREPDAPAHRLRLVPEGPDRFRAHALSPRALDGCDAGGSAARHGSARPSCRCARWWSAIPRAPTRRRAPPHDLPAQSPGRLRICGWRSTTRSAAPGWPRRSARARPSNSTTAHRRSRMRCASCIAAIVELDYKELAANTEKVFHENFPEDSIELPKNARNWWKFWT